jgi:hypothetical protein
MTLVAGTKLGPYEIQSPLDVGGMGERSTVPATRPSTELRSVNVTPDKSRDSISRSWLSRDKSGGFNGWTQHQAENHPQGPQQLRIVPQR